METSTTSAPAKRMTKKQLAEAAKAEGIPDFLLVKNRVPLKPEQQAKVDAVVKTVREERHDSRKPKGMSWEEWDAHLAAQEAAKPKMSDELKQELRAARKAKRGERPADVFALREWAHKAKLNPRDVRAAARKCTAALKPLEHGGKYLYRNSDEERVAKVIRDAMAGKAAAPKAKAATAQKPVVPAKPGELTSSSKATKTKPVVPPTPPSEKAKLRKEAAEAVKAKK